jgi:hypothetical protein
MYSFYVFEMHAVCMHDNRKLSKVLEMSLFNHGYSSLHDASDNSKLMSN